MEVVAFDTHQFIQTLSKSGMPVGQAEAISNAVRMAYAHGASDLATKADLAAVKIELTEKIEGVRTELNDKIEGLNDKIDGVRTELSEKIGDVRTEMNDKISSLSDRVTKLEHRVETIKTELEHSINMLGKNLTIRLGIMLFVSVGTMMALMKYMQP